MFSEDRNVTLSIIERRGEGPRKFGASIEVHLFVADDLNRYVSLIKNRA
jgi:hypothetical protein